MPHRKILLPALVCLLIAARLHAAEEAAHVAHFEERRAHFRLRSRAAANPTMPSGMKRITTTTRIP